MATIGGLSRSFARRLSSHLNPCTSTFSKLVSSRALSSEIFVKGLSFSTTEGDLTDTFSYFGEVVQARIIRHNSSNKSKGYGYVTFATEDSAHKALMAMNGKIHDGRVLFVGKEPLGAKLLDSEKQLNKVPVQRASTHSSACSLNAYTSLAPNPTE